METNDQLLDINTDISHKARVLCCDRLVRIVYKAGIKNTATLRNFEVIYNKCEDSS
jgi:hypothetical protein